MEFYLNVNKKGQISPSADGPDKQAAMTIVIRGGSTYKIAEMLSEVKDYVSSHDVILEGITAAVNKIIYDLGYKNANTTLISSILERQSD